jgi:hypothetical protein
MKVNKLLPLLLFVLIGLSQSLQAMTKQEYDQKIRQWHNAIGNEPSYETFEKGITWFLTKCASGNCNPCLLSITEPINASSGKTWIGTFSSSGPRTIVSTMTAINDGSNGHSRTPGVANKYGRCQQGATKISCSGGSCRYSGGYHGGSRAIISSSTMKMYEDALGESRTAKYMYAIHVHGQIMFHDGFKCFGRGSNCVRTWGCLDQYPKQQKALCKNYIDPAGGIHLYVDYNNNTRGDWQSAARALERGNFCNTVQGPNIPVVTPISGRSASTIANNSKQYENFINRQPSDTYKASSSPISGQTNLTGNEAFRECQDTSSGSYQDEVKGTRDGSSTNYRTRMAKIVNHAESTYGGAEQSERAAQLNNHHKDCQTMAATDPRSTDFINNDHNINPISKFFQSFLSIFSSSPRQSTPDLEYQSQNDR